ncbi:unnamed protein product [Heterobilharzia americana]|nr:unnamed protein product [Heterobilharzia americana]
MVTRDINVRLNIEERVKERLCFKKPTMAQMKRLAIPAYPFVEPLSQLQEFQEYSKTESVHKRAREGLADKGSDLSTKGEKIRRLMPFAKEHQAKCVMPQLTESPLSSELDLPSIIPDRDSELGRNSILRSHPFGPHPGICAASELLDEVASYEGETDILKIIKVLRENTRISFFYLTNAVPKRSTKYHFYNLKVVSFQNINRDDYYTLSLNGCTHLVANDDIEHISLERFETEYKTFKEICQIPTFARFRLWKGFTRWRKVIRYTKIGQCRRFLRDNLFIANSSLRPALLNIREMCYRIGDMGLCKLEKDKTYTLLEFLTNQVNQLNEVCTRLCEFRELVKEVVRGACRTALLEYGFMPDDYLADNISVLPGTEQFGVGSSYISSRFDLEVFSDAPEKMTFTEMASKRKHCQRLTCFIRLADYQIVSTLHVLTVNSVYTILDCLSEHLRNTPTLREIETYKIERFNKWTQIICEKTFPDESLFQDGILEIINKFQEQVFNIKNLTPDPYFDAFTRPLINNKFEEKTCGTGPELQNMFEEDTGLQEIINHVKKSLKSAFEAVNSYMNTFTEIHAFYRDNEEITTESVQTEFTRRTGEMDHVGRLTETVQFFKTNLLKHHRQVKIAELVPVQRPIGMFLIDTMTLRTRLLPSPNRCLEILHSLLPVYTHGEVDRLVHETQEAEYTLSVTPSSTVDYVNHFEFLNQIQGRSLLPSIDRAKNAIDKALADRDVCIDKFFGSLEKDVGELIHDIKDAKQAINNPILLDVTAESQTVRTELSRLKVTMDELQNRAVTFKTYHRNFKDLSQALSGTPIEDQILARAGVRAASFIVEQPRFEELETLVGEMKLKHLLWNSLEEWDETIKEWMKADFFKLNPEDLTNVTMKYVKSVNLLEKGLPPNTVVPLLKEKVEDIRGKLTTIMDLRNPTLKSRHWEMLEDLIGFQMSDLEEPLSLGFLNELKAFQKAEQIQEISGQASSEASLETLLKKVEDAWKSTEFIVLPYKDSKDVFIVGGTDEIQQLWDDSNINISTIASSRHVGPIKNRVDEWQRLLDLFGKTLDEWMQCQRSWLYLESIFSAPDIQRQLPSEAKSFMAVDKSYKDVMRKVQKVPLAMRAATQPGLLDTFRNNNQLLDQIQKCLEAYLESKRSVFPRFYFLSNDELLEILAQTRNPLAVQPHLRKCFDAIVKLEFAVAPESTDKDEPVYTNDILAMLSPEGERVSLGKG